MSWAIFRDAHIRAIGEMLNSESERVIAIVGGALLDDTLRRTLSERLRDDGDIGNKLFRVSGALGNTVPKIDLLYMLGAVDKPVRNALYGISDARNFFAHNLDASFDSTDKLMVDAMGKLALQEGRTHYPHHWLNKDSNSKLETAPTKRDVFLLNLRICLPLLMRDRVSHVTWSNTLLSPEEITANYERVEAEKVRLVQQEADKMKGRP